jgi:hypothetical protein
MNTDFELLPDPSPLPFESKEDDWVSVVNFETAKQFFDNLKGDRLDDVFHVERKLVDALAQEYGITFADVHAQMLTILPRWAFWQKRIKPIAVGQMAQTHLSGSKIEFQIFRTEKAYFVCLPRVELPK